MIFGEFSKYSFGNVQLLTFPEGSITNLSEMIPIKFQKGEPLTFVNGEFNHQVFGAQPPAAKFNGKVSRQESLTIEFLES